MLERIQKANDIKKLAPEELPELAQEIRQFLIEKISRTGGHLASNLGVVELTMAIHLVFDLPKDKIIWDVGHQSYTHKILTGRKDGFDDLRKYGGMSGFPKRKESACDAFDTGHSSTSISAGLGYVCARDLQKEDYSVISVIGDGSLTGGMAYEALNNASRLKKNFIIVLNDNHMSISENVGGMSDYLAKLRTADFYTDLKKGVTNMLHNVPVVGDPMIEHIRKTKSSLKQLIVPGMFFEDMGIKYLYQGDTWDFTLAFFKNADELLFGSDNETSDDRYGYDVAGRNKEINQFNGQAFYKFGESTRQRLGGSAEFGQLYNLDTRKNGTHYAFALHYELTTQKVSLKAQLTTYAMNPKNGEGDDNELISMTAYGAPYLVAAKANMYMLGAGYTIPVNRKFLKKIQVYNDFGWLDKQNNDYKDSFQNVTGCMLDGGPVCIYVDYALGKNHGWLGPDFNGFGTGGESDSWHARFNVNVGYYF